RLQEATLQAVVAVRRRYKSTPKRPAGPARRDRAFVQLLTELERVWDFATRPFGLQQSTIHPCTGEGSALSNAVVQTFNASAEVLTGGRPPDLRSLVQARAAHRDALDRWASESMCIGVAAEDVLAGLDVDHRLRLVSYLTLAIGTNAIIASGREMDREVLAPAGTPYEGGVQVALHRIKKTIRTHLAPSSGVLHHSLRVAIGLGVAVLLARVLQIDHAFWVVLGTLSVLRSNAFNTGRSTIEALIGSIAGFAVGALFTVLAGPTSAAVWIALPLVVFIATYSSSAIGFVVSQAAFTMLVIMLFNLISPVGWRLGLVRIEDVAIGAGISLVASAFLWPRGARGELARAVAGQYRGVAAYLGDAFARVLDPASVEDLRWSRQRAVQAGDRAGEAFDRFLNERGARPLDPETGAFLIAAGSHGIIAGDLLNLIAGMGYRVRKDGNGVRAVNAQVHRLLNGFDGLAEQLEGKPGANDGQIALSDDALREAALTGLRDWQHDPESGRAAMAIVMASEWTQELGGLTHDLQKPVAQAVKAAQMPWWR
ncbi:MAG: FUSC family protein, partial [Chloroflexota bacterium]